MRKEQKEAVIVSLFLKKYYLVRNHSFPDKFESLPPELDVLIEEFRSEALKLLQMLDPALPVVKKIKVVLKIIIGSV